MTVTWTIGYSASSLFKTTPKTFLNKIFCFPSCSSLQHQKLSNYGDIYSLQVYMHTTMPLNMISQNVYLLTEEQLHSLAHFSGGWANE